MSDTENVDTEVLESISKNKSLNDLENENIVPSTFSNEVYVCDRQFAIALAQLITVNEREHVYKWLER